jgi:hypothetical protein
MTSAVQQLAEDGSCARTLNTIYRLVDPIEPANIDQFWEYALPILALKCARGPGRGPTGIEGGVAWPYSRSPASDIWQSEPHDTPLVLVNWLIIKVTWGPTVSTTTNHLSGIVFGHPRLPDQHQVVTTTIQELAVDLSWARTRSRLYQLQLPLSSAGIDRPLKAEIQRSHRDGACRSKESSTEYPGLASGLAHCRRRDIDGPHSGHERSPLGVRRLHFGGLIMARLDRSGR